MVRISLSTKNFKDEESKINAELPDKTTNEKPIQSWDEEYLKYVTENFDDIFQTMYEDKFIDRLFGEEQNQMTRDKFVDSIVGDMAAQALEALNDLQNQF